MIKWLRRALIFLAIALPVLWVITTVFSYDSLMESRRLMSETNSEKATRMMETMHVRVIVGAISGLFHNLAISCLCLFAAHQLTPLGKTPEAVDD
jgi:hypothetical protein